MNVAELESNDTSGRGFVFGAIEGRDASANPLETPEDRCAVILGAEFPRNPEFGSNFGELPSAGEMPTGICLFNACQAGAVDLLSSRER